MPYQRVAKFVLDEWRALERRIALVDPGSDEAEALNAQAKALRDEYHHLVAEAEAHKRPVPPPFPDA